MKKKIIAIVMAAVLALCVFAGCSNGGSDTGSGANTDYMSWTATEWNAASDEEKEAATLAVIKFMAEDNDISVTDEMLSSLADSNMSSMISSIDTGFEAGLLTTLQDMADLGSSIMSNAS